MSVLILIFFIFIFLVISLRIYEIFKERRTEIEETTEPVTEGRAETTALASAPSRIKKFWEEHDIWGIIVVLIFGTSVSLLTMLLTGVI